MGYTVVSQSAVSPAEGRPCELRRLSEAAEMSNLAINRFRAEPGEQIPLAYHYHDEQEEAFYVLSGTLHVETPDGTYQVEPESLFTATPGSPHRAYNPTDADEAVEVLAVGAPAVEGDANEYDPDSEETDGGVDTASEEADAESEAGGV
ncbi:cupin domain-containing protein [Halobellus litoreus]|uniref:Cupin domain-containing protein n=1 Tax=Halobellus litoreus TaxID=755310 RepID=A0ABD6DUS8_9EURY|nr:cupin domain-containing protein [Halobellus litoreus]